MNIPPSQTKKYKRIHINYNFLTDDVMDVEMAEEDAGPLKKQKVMERCKFWPVCKSGDDCMYHHPTTQCK